MHNLKHKTVFLLICFLAILMASTTAISANETRNPKWAKPLALTKSDNLYQVTPNLYRAAQPSGDAFKQYEKFGIKTVINLRSMHSDRDDLAGTTLRLIEVPIYTWDISDHQVITVLKYIKNEPAPILLHCQHGADRTGLIIAMHRIVFEGWSKPEALDELKNGGYGYHSIWTNIPKYIENVDVQKIKNAVNP